MMLDNLSGQVIVIFILTLAGAEAAVGLSILILFYRNYIIEVDVLIESDNGTVYLGGRVPVTDPCSGVCQNGNWFSITAGSGEWQIVSGI